MDGYQLLAALVDSLVWPATMLGSIFIFRKKLIELLPRLQLKYKDTEAKFRLEQAEKDAAALPPPKNIPEEEPTPEEKSRFEKIAEISPRAAVLEVRTDIEEAVQSLAKSANLLTPRVQSTVVLTRLLRNKDVIGRKTSALLDDLRVIGNNAAHNLQIEYSLEEALLFRELANIVLAKLRSRQDSSK